MPLVETNGVLSGLQKAAYLFVVLGPQVTAQIMKHLNDTQIEQISTAIATLGEVSDESKKEILDEFGKIFSGTNGFKRGVSFVKDVLEKTVGSERATQMIDRLGLANIRTPFSFIRKTDPAQLLNFLQSEHPQTIALVLAHLDSNQAAVILSSLPAEQQVEVVRRIATMDKTTPEIIKEVEQILERKLSSVLREKLTVTGGAKTVAEVLNQSDRSTEKSILEVLEKDNVDLADQIKRMMFVFEDIILVDDRGIQQLLKETDNKELALALKTASEEVKDKIFKNMSSRAADAIKEDMEFMGPVRLKQVEEAQQRIVAIIRKLEDSGAIVIQGRGGEGDQIVE